MPTFGKGVVFDVDSKIRAEQFKFFASALQSSKLKSYVPLFVKESEVGSTLCLVTSMADSSVHHAFNAPASSDFESGIITVNVTGLPGCCVGVL